jgi:hypothetical protein
MNDNLKPEPPQTADAAQGKPPSDGKDLEVGNRKWQRRLTSIKESPVRVVLVACLIFYVTMVCLAAGSIISEGHPLLDTIWHILLASLCLGLLFTFLGIVILPIVWLWRSVSTLDHNRRVQNKRSRPVELDSARAALPPRGKPQTGIADKDRFQ